MANGLNLTPKLADAIVESVRRGCTPTRAAEANGVSSKAIERWLHIAEEGKRRDGISVSPELVEACKDLKARVDQARADCYQVLTSSLYHNATTPNAKTGWYDTQAADKLLSKSPDHRKDWFENKHLKVSAVNPPDRAFREIREIATTGGYEALLEYERRMLSDGGKQSQPSEK